MYIRIKDGSFTDNVKREIEAITNKAILHFRDVKYNEVDKCITLPITRYNFKTQRGFFGNIKPYGYDKNVTIKSVITVRNVTSNNITCNMPSYDTEITILFGMKVEDNKLLITSAEEDQGEPGYEIEIKVSTIDVEIRDV